MFLLDDAVLCKLEFPGVLPSVFSLVLLLFVPFSTLLAVNENVLSLLCYKAGSIDLISLLLRRNELSPRKHQYGGGVADA
jgi:hypothetical protein